MRILCLLLAGLLGCGQTQSSDSKLKFGSGEHVLLGNRAYEQACRLRKDCPAVLLRSDGKQSFYYGELVALSGDFYQDPLAVYEEQEQPWYQVFKRDAPRTKALFYRELASIQAMMDQHGEGDYPDLNVLYTLRSPGYLSISEQNDEHFGFNNILLYLRAHDHAIHLARTAHDLRQEQPKAAEAMLQKALFYNGFADHFLSDGFASGHIRNPRQQTRAWTDQRGLKDRTAGILSKIIHDLDGEIRESGEHGLPVRNARGDQWFARCDTQLFYRSHPDDPAARFVIEALAISVAEVLDAYTHGTIPPKIPKAIALVPFPSLESIPLGELFAPDRMDTHALYKKLAWYFRLPFVNELSPAVIAEYLGDIPNLMVSMQADVRRKLNENPELYQRLPAEYLQAYLTVR